MNLGEKIGEGRYRECWAVEDDPNICIKTVRREPYPITPDLPLAKIINLIMERVHELGSYKIPANEWEIEVIEKLRSRLNGYLPVEARLEKHDRHGKILIMTRPMDYDGNYSKTVRDHGPVNNRAFWRHIDEIVGLMLANDIFLFDIFHCGQNILLNKVSEDEYMPIIIDFKRFGAKSYPLQPNLLMKSERKRKFLRRLKDFKQKFMPAKFLV